MANDSNNVMMRLFADDAGPDIAADVDAWVRQDPGNARELVEDCLLEQLLVTVEQEDDAQRALALLLQLENAAEPLVSIHIPDVTRGEKLLHFFRIPEVRWAGLAASVAMVLSLTLWLIATSFSGGDTNGNLATQFDDPPDPPERVEPAAFAMLTSEHDARWETQSPPVGGVLSLGREMILLEGFAEVTTADGAIAILEAPCRFEIIDQNALHLHDGKLVGQCKTPSSRGFTVLTDNARVVDLGTVFGVEHRDGLTHTTVFEGEVTIAPAGPETTGAAPTYLSLGDSASVDADLQVELDTPASATRFVRSWASISAPTLAGEVTYERSLPKSLVKDAHENESVVLFLERAGIRLTSDLRADMTEPGVYKRFDETGSALAKGIRVDSYLVHYDYKPGTGDHRLPKHATITFDRPILGIIADETSLWASDRQLALAGVDYGQPTPDKPSGRGLERKLALPGDVVEISEDRKTLTIELYGAMAIDQMRVLVQTTDNDLDTLTP